MIYFDYTATTKPKAELLELHKKINEEYWYNTETMYYNGVKSHALLDKASKVVIDTLKLKNKKVLFTSGATEANNTAIYGTVQAYFDNPKHLITTYLEHSSVLKVFKDLEKRGFKVTYLEPKNNGLIDPEDLEKAITPDTVLVSCMWVNNTMGAIEPIKDVINIIKKHPRIKLHVDAVQGFSKFIPDFSFNDIDLITISGHKIEGLKGTGALLYNDKMHLSFLKGGHQQDGIRPGTVDLAGCVTMAKTIQLAYKDILEKYNDVKNKYDYLINGLKNLDFINLNVSANPSPYILSITFKNIKGETVLHYLEKEGIMVGTGSACNSHSKDQELSLTKTISEPLLAINTIRVSLSVHTTIDELDILINNIKKLGE